MRQVKNQIGSNMCGEPIYEITYVPKFVYCPMCEKKHEDIRADIIVKGKHTGIIAIPCSCGWIFIRDSQQRIELLMKNTELDNMY